MPEFFETMSRSEGLADASVLDLLRTHPVTRERIAEARARAAQYPYSVAAESSLYALDARTPARGRRARRRGSTAATTPGSRVAAR